MCKFLQIIGSFVFPFIGYSFQSSAQTQLAAWTFDTTPAAPSTPVVISANLGLQNSTATLVADGTNGASTWITATSGNEYTTFSGSNVNDPRTSPISGNALALLGGTGNSANGKSIVIRFSMAGYENPILSFATRGTSTGFNTHQWAWSTNGSSFTNFGTNTANITTTFTAQTLDMSSINSLDGASDVYLRLTVSGASTATGNNRLDNIVVNATSSVVPPPMFYSGYPKVSGITTSGFDVQSSIDKIGKVYFVVLPNNVTAPSSAQVKTGQDAAGNPLSSNLVGTMNVTVANFEYSVTVALLASNTDYDVFVVAEDLVPNLQATPTKIDVKTNTAGDTTPPSFSSSYPIVSSILPTGFTVRTSLDELGKTYFVVLPSGASAPSSTQVKNGQDGSGVALASNLTGTITVSSPATEFTTLVSGLTPSTSYDVFIVAEDNVPNIQTSPTKITVTSAPPPPVISPSITSLSIAGLTDKGKLSAAQTYTVSASNLTGDLSISVTGNFLLSTDNLTYTQNISIDKALAATPQTVYVKFNPSGNVGLQSGTISHASSGAATKTISLSAASYDPFNQNFNDPTFFTNSGWSQFSKVGSQLWASTNFGRSCLTGCNTATPDKAAQINGFSSGAPRDNEDWLISPLLDITGFVNFPVLSFWSISAFAGDGLQLKYSTNYTGSGDPTLATWTSIDGKFPPSNSSLWTQSSNIILPKQAIYVAFIYTSNTTAASRWTMDDWQVADVTSYIDVPAISYSFGEITAGNSSASKNFSFKSIGYGDVTVTPSTGYQVSLDNVSFAASQLVLAADAAVGKTVYLQFSPTVKQLKWDGVINFKGSGLDANYGRLTGSSYPKSETLDLVTYNLEFFGTNVKDTNGNEFGPTDNALQIANVTTVMQTISADIYAVQEVAEDAAFNQLVTNLPGYAGNLANRWSRSFDPPNPNFPPQKIGFVYNTSTAQLVNTRVMFSQLYDAVRAGNTSLLPGYPTTLDNGVPTTPANFWSSGRLPFMVTFDVTVNGFKKRIRAVVIHAKSGSAQADYDRRKYDVKVLRDSLVANYANDNVVLLGDFNDDVDVSIGAPTNPESTYKSFVDDVSNFNTLTFAISQAGAFSFPSSSSFLDHIITSNEFTNAYIPNSIAVEDARTYITNYVNTTSDHLPVSARFLLSVKTDQAITFNTLPARTFGDAAFSLSANSTSGLPVSYASSDPTIVSISGNTITILKAGTVNITASQAGDRNNNAATNVVQQLVINKANQTITFNTLANRPFGDAAFSLTANASSGLPISYNSSDAAIASISGNTVSILKAGTVSITASQGGDGNNNPATSVIQQLVINKANQTITFSALANRTFGDVAFNLSAAASSGLPLNYSSSDPTIASISGNTVTILKAGTVNITASQTGDGNNNAATNVVQPLVINKANQTITFNALPARTFGDAPFNITAPSSSSLPVTFTSSDVTTASVNGNTITILKAGTVTITASQTGDANFNAAPNASQQLTINKANQSITFNALTSRTFGDAPFNLTATSTSLLSVSFVSSDVTVASISGSTVTILKAGTVTITASQAGDGNYNPAPNAIQQFVVNKANQQITFTAITDKQFGDAPFALNANTNAGLPITFTALTSDKVTIANNQATIVAGGRAIIVASQPGNANYNAAAAVSQTFCIKPAKPTVNVSLASGNATLTSSASGGYKWFLNGTLIPNANGQSYIATLAGTYKVQVNLDDCLSDFSNDVPVVITGDLSGGMVSAIQAYPNPTSNLLLISGLAKETNQCLVVDVLGRAVEMPLENVGEQHQLNVEGLIEGMYVIRIKQNNSINQIRLVKNN